MKVNSVLKVLNVFDTAVNVNDECETQTYTRRNLFN